MKCDRDEEVPSLSEASTENTGSQNIPSPAGRGKLFPDTQWTKVLIASETDTIGYESALTVLWKQYREPLGILIRNHPGIHPQDVEDLRNEFFYEWLRKNRFRTAHAKYSEKGGIKLRDFLARELKSFLIDRYRRSQAEKRSPGRAQPLDDLVSGGKVPPELCDYETPDLDFQRAWALSLLAAAAGRTREKWRDEIETSGKAYALPFEDIWPLSTGEASGHRQTAEAAGTAKTNVTQAVAMMKQLFISALTAELEETLPTRDPVAVLEELEALRLLHN